MPFKIRAEVFTFDISLPWIYYNEETSTLKVLEKYLTSLSGESNKSLGAIGGMYNSLLVRYIQ